MSKKQYKKSTHTNLVDLAEEYLLKSSKEIVTILKNKYKFNNKTILELRDEINTSTLSEMRQLYAFKKNFTAVDEYGKIKKSYGSLNDYLDFVDWSLTALTVPFYQSLGDTIGYYNGNWEFNRGDINVGPDYVNELIYEFIYLGGVNDLSIKNWRASDDTILYMATLDVLTKKFTNINDFGEKIRNAYLSAKPKIQDRHPGQTTNDGLEVQQNIKWNMLPYNSRSIGAGSAMRSGCIGIFYPGRHNRRILIELSVESSRITHNSTTAILGSVVASLFTAYGLERVPINLWPHKLLKLLRSNMIDDYMKKSRSKNEYESYEREKIIYIGQWDKYVTLMFSGINIRSNNERLMRNPVLRYKYLSENFSKGCGMPGACGDDSVIMAYDALLRSDGIFEKLIVYSILHPGDSDTVGSIAFSWFGAFYHSPRNENLVDDKFKELEFYDQLYDYLDINIPTMVGVYYYDIYMNIARKYIKQFAEKKK